MVTVNLIQRTINGALGQEAKTRLAWKASADTGAFSEVAAAMNDRLHEFQREAKTDMAISEAYSSIQVPDGDYPGEDAILAQAEQDCLAAFNTFAGINYDQSTLSFSYYYPTAGSWDNGDREILCLIYEFDVKTTGSLAGAAR